MDELLRKVIFESDTSADAQIRAQASQAGIHLASIQPLYQAIGRSEISGFTVPAINVRTLTYDFAQLIFRQMMEHQVGPVIFELAISEQEYTHQPPHLFAPAILAAALKAGYKGPVFIQGDHYQFKPEKYRENKTAELDRIKAHIKDSIEAGFYNIDIDGSTLVDLEKPDLHEQQRENYTVTAAMTEFIRSLQPKGITISIGGEIGHIGGKNSTVEDFQAFMRGYQALLSPGTIGISKVSVQTGTSHGGVVKPDGTLEKVPVDLSVLKEIGDIARTQFGMGGAVQHGASTLPDKLFHSFPENGTLEIHLSTGFQNIVFDHMPTELREKINTWLRSNMADEKKPDMTDEQFIYKTRKKSLGQFEKDLWMLDEAQKQPILNALETKIAELFKSLDLVDTQKHIEKYML